MSERDPELDRLFRAARREEAPTDDDRRAVRRAIAARIAAAAAAGTAASLVTRAAAAAGAASVGKATMLGWFAAGLGAGATLGAVVTATVVLRERDERPMVSSPAVVTASAPVPHVVPAPRAPRDPVAEATATAAAPPAEKPTGSVPEAASRPPSLEVETRALGAVTRALRDGRPEEALRLLADQERTFVRGSLHEERAAARVLALCGAGRLAAARSARERFLIDYPESPSADRVRASCAP